MTDKPSITDTDTLTTVDSLEAGRPVEGVYRVAKAARRLNRNGDAYLALTLTDQTGTVEARVWKNVEHFAQMTTVGEDVHVWGRASEWSGETQLNIRRIEPLDGVTAPLIPAGTRSADELAGEIDYWLSEIADPGLHALARAIWQGEHRERLLASPATLTDHHDYVGGLAEHTLAVTEICHTAAQRSPRVNLSLVVTAALLHAIGQAFTVTIDGTMQADEAAQLTGDRLLTHELLLDHAGRELRDSPLWPGLLHAINMSQGPFDRIKTKEAALVFSSKQLDQRLHRR